MFYVSRENTDSDIFNLQVVVLDIRTEVCRPETCVGIVGNVFAQNLIMAE